MVLTDVKLELDNGVYGLLTPDGAGKTTLMKMITTLLFPTEGQIKYDGEDIRRLDGAYREKIGYLPQDLGYYGDYTPEEYLRYIGILKSMPRKKLTESIDRVLELTGMAAVYGLPPVDCGGFFHRALPDAVYGDPLSG